MARSHPKFKALIDVGLVDQLKARIQHLEVTLDSSRAMVDALRKDLSALTAEYLRAKDYINTHLLSASRPDSSTVHHCKRSDHLVIHDDEYPNNTLAVDAEAIWPKLGPWPSVDDLEEQINDLRIELEAKESELADLKAERDSSDG